MYGFLSIYKQTISLRQRYIARQIQSSLASWLKVI